MLEEATVALSLLDEAQLNQMADKLQALLDGGVRVPNTAEVQARQRVFAGVLRATGENMAVLERVVDPSAEVSAWAR